MILSGPATCSPAFGAVPFGTHLRGQEMQLPFLKPKRGYHSCQHNPDIVAQFTILPADNAYGSCPHFLIRHNTAPCLMTMMMHSQQVVTPAKAGVRRSYNLLKPLDSGFRRNDGKGNEELLSWQAKPQLE
jgi:hypothetical protein